MKLNPHKRCSCRMCMYGARLANGKRIYREAERALRHLGKLQLHNICTGVLDPDEYTAFVVSDPYTD